LPETDALALDAFLKSMEPVPSPYLEQGKLSASAERGKEVFVKAKCSECHTGPYYTDLQLHDVGTGEGYEYGTAFDVPSLNEVWRTAPYLYDGRAETIRDVVIRENPDDRHGQIKDLTEGEVNDLITYVLSL
ncbi:MAG: c-type cytochrome, partial [Verrucomicrobiae bacterium]|nr:c-type cytochrome [Verrucomicrobiae bacterium]